MNNNSKAGLVGKVIMGVLILVGVVLSYFIMSDGNPDGLDEKGIQKLGTEVAKAQNAQETMNQGELLFFIQQEGMKKRDEMSLVLHKDVSNVINFTFLIGLIAGLSVVFGLVMALISNPKKFLISISTSLVFIIILIAIYYGVSDEVPTALVEKENLAILENTISEDQRQFIAPNWRIATWAFVTTGVLIFSAVLALVAGEVAKIFR